MFSLPVLASSGSSKKININSDMAAAPQPFIMTSVIPVGPRNTRMVCPSCHSTIVTKVKSSPGVKAWISGLVLAMVG